MSILGLMGSCVLVDTILISAMGRVQRVALTSNYGMEISDQIGQLLPSRFEIDAQNIKYLRTFNEIKLPDASRTPTEYWWLWRGQVTESYLVAIDKQIYMPGQDTIVLNIMVEENNLNFARAAYWRGRMWGYSVIGGIGPTGHLVDHNSWSWTVFQAILSPGDFKYVVSLDRTCHWIQLARSEMQT